MGNCKAIGSLKGVGKSMERNLAFLLSANLHRIFDETDVEKRKAAIVELWDEQGVFIDPEGLHEGSEKLSAAVTALQRHFPGFVFKETSPVQENCGAGRIAWEYGAPGQAPVVRGIDVGVMMDGKLVALYVFID
jgi:hypothetical protein